MKVCVVGLGYVGLPLAVALAGGGVEVVGYDASATRVAELTAGRSGIEDVSDAALAEAGLTFTTEPPADCTAYVVCVPTPLADGLPDLTAVTAATRSVAAVLKPGDLFVLESTTYPGTTEEVVAPLLREITGSDDFLLAYSPERIDPGNPTYGIANTPKVVGGTTPEATARAAELYGRVVEQVVLTKGTREAEMAKLLENTFRHVNIALVNEMAVFCRELGVDLWDAIDAAATKPFGFMRFTPGPGVGGHCIPVDPSYLSWRVKKLGFSFRFVELAQEVNARMPAYVVTRLADLLNDQGLALSRSRILCLGVAYKPGVADTRESPALEVMQLLRAKGADVRFSDPHVAELDGQPGATLPEALADVDVVVVLTAHPEVDWDLVAAKAPLVLDTRAVLPESPTVIRL
ncbi:MAG: nucleotide sugar dehydrogenase [Actinobacteria bacterium]|nr:nucleotide sugar dehydrogenase [Actinomycetota bacterium]MCA1720265.1 nucleotide sugar dehydrogenase [Actinomycetota bacterium]